MLTRPVTSARDPSPTLTKPSYTTRRERTLDALEVVADRRACYVEGGDSESNAMQFKIVQVWKLGGYGLRSIER